MAIFYLKSLKHSLSEGSDLTKNAIDNEREWVKEWERAHTRETGTTDHQWVENCL